MINVLVKHIRGNAMSTEQNYYQNACEVTVPIVLKLPIYVEPEVTAKAPECKNGYKSPYPQPVSVAQS